MIGNSTFGQNAAELLVKNEPIQTFIVLLRNKQAEELSKQLYRIVDTLDKDASSLSYFVVITKAGLSVISGSALHMSNGSCSVFDSAAVSGRLTGYLLVIQLPQVYLNLTRLYNIAVSVDVKQQGKIGKTLRYTVDLVLKERESVHFRLYFVELNGIKYDIAIVPNRQIFAITLVDKGPNYILKSSAYDQFTTDNSETGLSELLTIETNMFTLSCLPNLSTKLLVLDSMIVYTLDKNAKHRFQAQNTDKKYVLIGNKLLAPSPVFKASEIGKTFTENITSGTNLFDSLADITASFETEPYKTTDNIEESEYSTTSTVFDALQTLVSIEDIVTNDTLATDIHESKTETKGQTSLCNLYGLAYTDIVDGIQRLIGPTSSAYTVLYDIPLLRPELHELVIAKRFVKMGNVWFVDISS